MTKQVFDQIAEGLREAAETPPAWAMEKAREVVSRFMISSYYSEYKSTVAIARALAEADKAAAERERKTISDFAIKHPIEDEDVWESSEWHRGYGAARRCISNAAIRGAGQ